MIPYRIVLERRAAATRWVRRAGPTNQEITEGVIQRRLHAVVGRSFLIGAHVPMTDLLHLLLGAEVNGPETFSAATIEAQMQVAWMLQGFVSSNVPEPFLTSVI